MSDKRKIGEVYYEIYATNDRLGASIKQSGAHFRGLAGIAQQSNTDIARAVVGAAEQSESALHRVEAATGRAGAGFGLLRRAAAGLGAYLGARELVAYADTWTLVTNRLRLVTRSSEELEGAQRRLFQIAQETRTGYEGTAETFTRLTRNSKELGKSQGELLGVTETINQALRVSGGSASSANAALVQLSQAFASGVLRGEEFNSVMEQAPRLAEAIAAGLGVTIAELRRLAADGQLTSKAVVEALQSQASVIDAEFQQMTGTVSEAFTQIQNAAMRWVGEASEASGASVTLAGSLSLVAENFGAAANAALLFAAAAVGKGIAAAVDRVRALAGAQIAAAASADIAAQASARSALMQAKADERKAVAAERATAADLHKLRTEQQALVRAEQRARADLNAARAAEATAKANLDVARTAEARALAELQLEQITIRRTRASATLRGVEAQQIATSRLVGQSQVALGAAQNATAAATARSGAAFTGFARSLTGVSGASRLATGAVGLFRTGVSLLGGPWVAGALAALYAISTALGVVKGNAAAAKDELEKFTASLDQESVAALDAGKASLEERIRGARERARDPRATQGARSAAADEVPALLEQLKVYERLIAAKQASAATSAATPQAELDKEADMLAKLIRLGVANNAQRSRAAALIRETRSLLAGITADDEKSNLLRIQLQERINKLQEADSKERKSAVKDAEALKGVLERATNLEIQTSGADSLKSLQRDLKKLYDTAQELGLAGADLEAFGERLQRIALAAKERSVAEMSDELRQLSASMTLTAADDLALEIEKLEQKFKGATGATREQADALIQLKRDARDAAIAAEALQERLDELDRLNKGGAVKDMPAMGLLLAERDRLDVELRSAKTKEERLRISTEIAKVDEKIAALQERSGAAIEAALQLQRALSDEALNTAGKVEAVANAAFGIVSAFEGANSEAARFFGSVGQIAGGVGKLSKLAKDAGGFKSLFSSGEGVASALGPMGQLLGGALAIGSLLKEDPEVARQRVANTKALQDLTRAVGSLDLGATAQNRATAVRVAADVAADIKAGRFGGDIGLNSTPLSRQNDALRAALDAAGMSFDEFKRQAQDLRIEIGDLGKVTDAQLEAIVQAADTLGARLETLRSKFDVLRTEPAERLAATLALLSEKGDEYARALAAQVQGYDLATDAGRDAADAAVRAAYEAGQISAPLAKELLSVVDAVTEAAAAARDKILRQTRDEFGFFDQDDAGQQLDAISDAYAEQIPILARLREGLDLTTEEGLAEFDRRLRAFYEGVKDGSIVLDGFTMDEVIAALFELETASDATAASIRRRADAERALSDDLDVQELRNEGKDQEADSLEFRKKLDKDYEDAVKAGVSPETLARLKASNDARFAKFVADATGDEADAGSAQRAGSSTVDAGERITEQTGSRMASGIDSLVILTREQNALMQRVGSLGNFAVPAIQPPLLPSAYLAGRGGGGGSSSTTSVSAPVQVSATFNFYGPVSGDGAAIGRRAADAFLRDVSGQLAADVGYQKLVAGRTDLQ